MYTFTPQVLLEYDTVIQLKSEKVRVLGEFYSTLVICIRFTFFSGGFNVFMSVAACACVLPQ